MNYISLLTNNMQIIHALQAPNRPGTVSQQRLILLEKRQSKKKWHTTVAFRLAPTGAQHFQFKGYTGQYCAV